MYRQRLWIPMLPPALSDFERDQVSERTQLALQYTRARGEKTGRKRWNPKTIAAILCREKIAA